MKKILMLVMVCSQATGSYATDNKPKQLKKCKQCTQQNCKPVNCKPVVAAQFRIV